jgi:outer membrane protein TolC
MKTALILLLLVSGAIHADEASKKQPQDPARGDLASLQLERVRTLEQLMQFQMRSYQEGLLDFGVISQTGIRLMEARIEAAQSKAEKIKLLEQTLESAKKTELLAAERKRTGLSTTSDVLDAKAHRLLIAIRLVEARQR